MTDTYTVHCECGASSLTMTGEPKVRGICHCEDCRELLQIPFHAVTAWQPDQVSVADEGGTLETFQHPSKNMKRVFCRHCGETLYNTNAMDWRVVSQWLIRKCHDDVLPEALAPKGHFFYARRVFDIDDSLPKRD